MTETLPAIYYSETAVLIERLNTYNRAQDFFHSLKSLPHLNKQCKLNLETATSAKDFQHNILETLVDSGTPVWPASCVRVTIHEGGQNTQSCDSKEQTKHYTLETPVWPVPSAKVITNAENRQIHNPLSSYNICISSS